MESLCKGNLFKNNLDNICYSSNRDGFCKDCKDRKKDGSKLINSNKILIISSKFISNRNSSCQLLNIEFLNNYKIQINKRSKIIIDENHFNCYKLIIYNNKDKILSEHKIVDAVEIAGDNLSDRHPHGTARIPGFHFGDNSSIVLTFINSKDKENFYNIFYNIFNFNLMKLSNGEELYIFDSKRTTFVPYCSILNNVINDNPVKCKNCSSISHDKYKTSCLDLDRLKLQNSDKTDKIVKKIISFNTNNLEDSNELFINIFSENENTYNSELKKKIFHVKKNINVNVNPHISYQCFLNFIKERNTKLQKRKHDEDYWRDFLNKKQKKTVMNHHKFI